MLGNIDYIKLSYGYSLSNYKVIIVKIMQIIIRLLLSVKIVDIQWYSLSSGDAPQQVIHNLTFYSYTLGYGDG